MNLSLQCLDLLLGLTLVVVGLKTLLGRDLFQSIVLFIIFSMLLGIAWCRLEAVDVALAEVTIGAGLTGALMLSTLSATRRRETESSLTDRMLEAVHNASGARSAPISAEAPPERRVQKAADTAGMRSARPSLSSSVAAVLFTIISVLGLAAVVVPLVRQHSVAGIPVAEMLALSGVSNPVTAVLLNFRAYDTLLEVAVLFAAVLPASMHVSEIKNRPSGAVLRAFIRVFVPLAMIVATYVLWSGTKAPGGAFQAAAILGSIGVLMIVSGARPPHCARASWRMLLVMGLLFFLLVGISGVMGDRRFLEFSSRTAGTTIILVETGLTISIALILVLLFCGTSPEKTRRDAVTLMMSSKSTDDERAFRQESSETETST